MKKEEYAAHAFAENLRGLIALAAAADTPSHVIYGLLRAWSDAYEQAWEHSGTPPAMIAGLQGKAYEISKKIAAELQERGPSPGGKFPDEVPDPAPKEVG